MRWDFASLTDLAEKTDGTGYLHEKSEILFESGNNYDTKTFSKENDCVRNTKNTKMLAIYAKAVYNYVIFVTD